MFQYLVRRILLFIPTLFLITVLTFLISRLAPGDPAELKAGVGAEGSMKGNHMSGASHLNRILYLNASGV